MLEDAPTRQLLDAFCSAAAPPLGVEVRAATPYSELKRTFADLDPREDPDVTPRTRSELFEAPMRAATLASLLSAFADRPPSEGRQLTFLAMGGAYGRVPVDATAFAHRHALFSLEHLGSASSRVGRPVLGDRPRGRLRGRLPQLPGPGPRRLGPGLPRRQRPPPGSHQARLRPRPALRLPAVHRTRHPGGLVTIRLYMSMSLDGYIAGPDDREGQELGRGGGRLFNWLDERTVPASTGRCTPRPCRPAPSSPAVVPSSSRAAGTATTTTAYRSWC